jgi:nucleotide-binding universal stress UspA family protein
MKTILVLTDFSSLANNAASYAVKFAQQIQANLLLFNAFGSPEINNIASQGIIWQNNFAELQKRSEVALKDLRVKLELEIKTHLPKADFYPEISFANDFGAMSDLIEEITFKKSVGLIVMGGQHLNNFTRLFLGSDTHDLLDKVVSPVLIIPEGVTYHKLEKITYATDLKSTDQPVISSIAALGKIFSANISITHIEPNPNPARSAIIQNLELDIRQHVDYKNINFKVVNGKNITKTLCTVSETEKTDMLVLMHKKYHLPESIFHTSVSKLMAKTCFIPLLVYPFTYHQPLD